MVIHRGFEPRTPWLKVTCSTDWANESYWQGWQDLNLRMLESKSSALPLGDTPTQWGGRWESNPRPQGPQSCALTNWATPAISGAPEGIRTPDPRLRRPMLYPAELQVHTFLSPKYVSNVLFGAGDGNRTHAASLEGWNSTIELHPHLLRVVPFAYSYHFNNAKRLYHLRQSMSTIFFQIS